MGQFEQDVRSVGRTILNGLQGFADWIGLGSTLKEILTGTDVITESKANDVIKTLIAKAKNLSNDKISAIEDRINGLPFNVSPTVKSVIQNARRKLAKEKSEANLRDELASIKLNEAASAISEAENAKLGDVASGHTQKIREKGLAAAQEATNIIKGAEINV